MNFFIEFNDEKLALNEVSRTDFYSSLKGKTYRVELSPIYANEEMRAAYLASDAYGYFNVWDFNHALLKKRRQIVKNGHLRINSQKEKWERHP